MNMTKREGAILSAYTGILLGDFSSMHEYAEEKLGHPIFTHQFADELLVEQLKEASKQDFLDVIEGQV
jgi:hypothetical protein